MTQMTKEEFQNRTYQKYKPDPPPTQVPLWVWGIGALLVFVVYMILAGGN